jgi:hypothetical protein
MAQSSRKVEQKTGRCPEHGVVEGVRYLPRPMFPFILYYLRLRAARRAPYLCPQCDRPLTLDVGQSGPAGMQKAA